MSDSLMRQRAFHQHNRKQLRQLLNAKKESSDLVVVTGHSFMQAASDRVFPFVQDSSFFYLTGITEPEVILVLDKDQEYLIIPERSEARVAFEGAINTEHMSRVSGIETIITEVVGWKQLGGQLKTTKSVATLLASENYIPSIEMFTNPSRQRLIGRLIEANKTLEFEDIRPQVTSLRMVKSDYELAMIRQAIEETQALFAVIEQKRISAEYEHELLAEITRITVKKQLTNAYDPIIASAANALILHYTKNNARIDKTGIMLLDIGLTYNGYAADISRTISYAPTKRQQAVFDAVLAVQRYALSLLKPGIVVKEYEAQVHEYMGVQLQQLGLIKANDKESVRRFYPHAMSHFLGLDVHDVGDYQQPLKPGMVLTVEPGIYITEEKIGIRLEDDVVITEDGNEILSGALPKNLSSLTIEA